MIGMSVFVAFFFLLLVLADFTPRAAASIPLIGAYFCLSMVMITLSTVLACVVANMYFRGVRINEAPLWLKVLMVDWLSHVMCVTNKPKHGKDFHITSVAASSSAKMNWSNHINGKGKNGRLSDPEFKFAKVRLLDNGVDQQQQQQQASRMLATQESFDSCNFECYSDRTTGSRNGPLLDEVRGIREILQRHEDWRVSKEERERRIWEWRVIACVTDRVFFVMYVIINFAGLMVIFLGT